MAVFVSFFIIALGLPYAGSLTNPTKAQAAYNPAQAQVDVAAITNGLQSLCDFTKGLATDGKMGQALPLLQLVPGSADGFGFSDLCQSSIMQQVTQLPNPASCTDLATLAASALSLTNNRAARIALGTLVCGHAANGSTNGLPDSLPIDLSVDRTISSGGLNLNGSGNQGPIVISSTNGVQIVLHADLALTVSYNWDTGFFSIVDNAGSRPTLSASATISIPNGTTINAGLGILKIGLSGSLNGTIGLNATMSDPTGSGQLGFATGTGGAGNAALKTAQIASLFSPTISGSLTGTMTVAPQNLGSYTFPSTANATFGVSVPDVNNPPAQPFTGMTNFSNLLDNFESLTPRDLADGLGHLVQAIRAVEAVKSGLNLNVNLPFMQGSLSDAAHVEESLVNFLVAHVKNYSDPTTGTTTNVSQESPDFASLQDLLGEFTGALGATNVNFNPDLSDNPPRPKLSFTLGMSKVTATAVNLDPGAQVADPGSANTTYTTDTVQDTSSPAKTWRTNQWTGAAVATNDGLHSGIVASNTVTSLTLQSPWTGGQPADGTPYQIMGQDPQTGKVNLGSLKQGGTTFLLNANASVPQATISPTYSAGVTLVLDLEPALTGSDCADTTKDFYWKTEDPGDGTTPAACPFVKTGADGSQMVVNSLPTAPDRIMVRTAQSDGSELPLFSFDAPIDTHVAVDAQAGFLDVHLDGDLKECTTNTAADCSGSTVAGKHLISVALKAQADAAHNYDVPITQLFGDLLCPTSGTSCPGPAGLIDASVNGQAYAGLTLSIPQAAAFFNGNPSVTTSVTMADITSPTAINLDTSGLSKLADFNFDTSNPRALFGAIVKGLQVLLQALQNAPGGASTANSALNTALNTTIPVLNRSLKDLLASSEGGVGDPVSYGTTIFGGNTVGQITDTGKNWPAGKFKGRQVIVGTDMETIADNDATHLTLSRNWQAMKPADRSPYLINNELEAALTALTAKPSDTLQSMVTLLNNLLGTDAVKFTVNESDPTNPMLELDVDWKRSFQTEAPVGFDLSPIGGSSSVAGIQAGGVATLDAGAEVNVGLLVPMTTDVSKSCYLPTSTDVASLLTSLCITSGSSISAGVTGTVNGFIKANIGPVAVALGKPDDTTNHGAQAKATLSAGLSDPTAGPTNTVESIGTFLSNVAPSFNAGTPVTCPSDTANTSTDKLALCGAFPLYVLNGTTWNAVGSNDELFLRLPQTSDPTKALDLTGNLSDGTTPRFGTSPAPSQILSDIAAQVLDLNALNGGIDGYFQFAENALNLASDNGKLPLVGQDLQQGSAFLTNLQAQFDAALGSLASVGTVNAVQTAANQGPTSLQGVLDSHNLLPAGGKVTVGLVCGSGGQLQSPAATAVATVQASDVTNTTHSYTYEVVAVAGDGNGGSAAAPAGTASSAVMNVAAPLNANDYNTITWTTASNLTYQVWRSVDGGSFFLLKDNASSGYQDNGTDTPGTTAYTAPTSSPCDPNASVTNIRGVTLEVIVGQGNVSSTVGCYDQTTDSTKPDYDKANPCLGAGLGTPFSIGIPGLSFSAAGSASQNLLSVKLGWKLHLKFGIDTTHGFFIDTAPGGDNPIAAGVALDIPAGMKLNIAFLQMCVANHGVTPDPCTGTPPAATKSAFAGEFDVALNSPRHDGMITGADLAGGDLGSLVSPMLQAAVNIDWDFLVDTSAGTTLPGLGGEFVLSWGWSNAAPQATDPTIAFQGIYIDAGSFLSGVLQPIVKEVNSVLDPIRPIIDVLTAPIPVLSDLSEAVGGPPVTLITIAKAFSTLVGGPDLSAVDEVVQVVKFVADLTHEISTLSGQSIHIPLGSFNVSGPAAKATTATPDNADQLETNVASCDGSSSMPSSCGGKSTFEGLNSKAGSVLNDTKTSSSSENQYGFELTALKKPSSLFGLLMGKDVELFAFDSGPLTLAFSYTQQFGPVYAPPPVLVVISGSASVSARIRIGFDTYGLRQAFTNPNSSVPLDILDSLYISTTDPANGQPIPAITLTGTLAAGAEVSVVFISVGIEGGITLTINLLWNDQDNDGKLRFDEFLSGLQNPLCLFNFSGSLKAFIKLFIDIGFSPFDFSFSFDLVDVTLLDFSTNNSCAKPKLPPVLGDVSGGVLYVHGGNLGGGSFRNDPSSPTDGWGNDGGQHYTNADEKFVVTELHDPTSTAYTGMAIDWQGHHQEFGDTSIHTVELDARGYGGAETITLTGDGKQAKTAAAFDQGAIIFGGSKNNTIKIDDACPGATACTVGAVDVGGGTGSQTNANQIQVGDGAATVAGGPGGNQIQVGNGDDFVAGNGALTYSTVSYHGATIVDPSQAIGHAGTWSQDTTNDGNDTIHVGLGADTVWGGAGNDAISVGRDSPLSTLPSTNPKFCNTPGVCVSKGVTIIGGGGNNHITSGSGNDTIWAGQYQAFTSADTWTGVAGDGYNTVDTGPGNKTVYGGSGGNFVMGHSVPGTVDTIYGGSGDDELLGGDGNDVIYGEGGNNVIIGGHGSSLLVGGSGDDYIVAGGGDVEPKAADPATTYDGSGVPIRTVTLPPPSPSPIDGHNTIIGGGGSNHLYGGDNGDTIYGHYSDETCTPPAAGAAPYAVGYDVTKEHAGEATDTDLIFGGAGNDVISGGGGTNIIDSGAGNDLVCGGSGNDTITGHSTPTQVDRFFGIAGSNTIYGGNGNDQLFGGSGDDTIYAGTGNSYVEGGDGDNTIYAGGGNDAIIGGTSTPGKRHNAATTDPSGTPNVGRLFGGTGVAVIVGDNGCVDMTNAGPEVSFPSATVTVNSCNPPGTPNALGQALQVFDLASGNPTLGEDNTIHGGQGPSMIFGGLGSNTIIGGPADDHIEGGTGNNYIEGGGGSNDIIGGTSPQYLPAGTCPTGAATSCIPAGANVIYGDDGTGGVASATTDGSNAVVADNGSITRTAVTPGWAAGALASNPITWGDGSTVPNRTITDLDIYTGDSVGSDAWVFGGTRDDFLFGGPGNDHIYGGPPVVKGVFSTATRIDPNGLFGNDYFEGGPGFNSLYGGAGQNDMIGGSSPFHLGAGNNSSQVANTGSHVEGGNGDNYIVADNGEIDHQCGPAGNPTTAACTTPSTPWTVDPNSGSYFRTVTLHDLLTIGGDSTLLTGNGYDHAFGGKGNDVITGGAHDDYLMGGPGNNTITGGTGSNDIIGGTAPEVLPAGTTTAGVPAGSNVIFAGGTAPNPADGSNVVIGSNGDITRQHDPLGVWIRSNNDPTDPGILQRTVVNLDIYGYPLPSEPGTPDVLGGHNVIFGGTRDDLLLGGPGGNAIYAGPPSATGTVVDPTTGLHFDNTAPYGNNHIEGGPGANAIYGAGGDDDVVGGVTPLYLQAGHDTGMVGSLDTPNHAGNLLVGGTGNDYITGANAQIDHKCGADLHVCAPVDTATWARNANDQAFIRQARLLNLDSAAGPTGPITRGIGSDNRIYGTAGDNHLYGDNGNNFILGGPGYDYIEGGPGNNVLQGGGGDNDLIGGTSPASIVPGSSVAATDAKAAIIPSGSDIICSFVCGRSMVPGSSDPLTAGGTSNDAAIVAHNGRIDRCPAVVAGGVGTPQGSDNCTWQRTSFGNEQVRSRSGGLAQTGQLCTTLGPGCSQVGLGNPRTRFITLVGQSPTETVQNATDYLEGGIGNDVIRGGDGPDVVHGDVPPQNSPHVLPTALFPQYGEFGVTATLTDECLPAHTTPSQDIIQGGYGNDVLCGGVGDKAILGNRGLITVSPFSGGTTTIGSTSGAPYGTLTIPASGNTIYKVDLSHEYVDGVVTPVPNWNNPTATAQINQHDIIFGGQGNNTIHGSPGSDFIQGGDGMHIAGQPAQVGGDNIVFGGGGGNNSIEGGPGNADIFGGPGSDDQDVKRNDTAIAPKVDNAGNCLPIAFPTINAVPTGLVGYCATTNPNYGWANVSYASRFPLPAGQAYDADPGGLDNGGTTSHTNVFGHVAYGGASRDISQAQGFGDRIIDSVGAYNLEYVCPAAYGGYQINRALSPGLLTFVQQLAAADGAFNVNQASKPPATLSSGDLETAIVYPGGNSLDNSGSAYPTTAGHFTC